MDKKLARSNLFGLFINVMQNIGANNKQFLWLRSLSYSVAIYVLVAIKVIIIL